MRCAVLQLVSGPNRCLIHSIFFLFIFVPVVVDFHDDKSASTGDFELLYEYELPNSPRRERQRQIVEENRQKQNMMDEIIRDIVNDVITVINVAPPPENEVDVSREVKELFDPYKQMLLAAV